MSKSAVVLYTVEQFDNAMIKILGEDYCRVLTNRPQRANAAILNIFLEGKEKVAKYRESCEIIRHVTNLLQIDGVYKFADPVPNMGAKYRTDRQKLHLANACGISVYDLNNVGIKDRSDFADNGWIYDDGYVTPKGARYITTGKA